MYDEMERRGITVIAISQEDKDLESHAKFLNHFGDDGPPFLVLADLNREKTTELDRTTTYLIDSDGVVRQVFPNLIRHRASWDAILSEADRLGVSSSDSR